MNRINHDVSFALGFMFAAVAFAWFLDFSVTLHVIAAAVGLFFGKASAMVRRGFDDIPRFEKDED